VSNQSPNEAVQRAEAKFKKKEIQAREGAKAMADYLAQGKIIAERTAKLRAARLAKEASDKEAAANKPVAIKPASKSVKPAAAKRKRPAAGAARPSVVKRDPSDDSL
jgi:hypothetical protein